MLRSMIDENGLEPAFAARTWRVVMRPQDCIREASRKLRFDSRARGDMIKRLRFVEAHHFNSPFNRRTRAADLVGASLAARDRNDATVKLGRVHGIDP